MFSPMKPYSGSTESRHRLSQFLITCDRFPEIFRCLISPWARSWFDIVHDAGILGPHGKCLESVFIDVIVRLIVANIWNIGINFLFEVVLGKRYFLLTKCFLWVILTRSRCFLNSVINLCSFRLTNQMSLTLMSQPQSKSVVHRPRTVIIVIGKDFARCCWDRECRRSVVHNYGSRDSLF